MPIALHNFNEKRYNKPEYNSQEVNHEGDTKAILGGIPPSISTKKKQDEMVPKSMPKNIQKATNTTLGRIPKKLVCM